MPILLTNRIVSQIEKGRIIEKIGKWKSAETLNRYLGDATWAQRVQDSSGQLTNFVAMLVKAGARDPDLIWAIVKESAIWREYESRKIAKGGQPEKLLWAFIVSTILAKIPPSAPSTGQPVAPSFTK